MTCGLCGAPAPSTHFVIVKGKKWHGCTDHWKSLKQTVLRRMAK